MTGKTNYSDWSKEDLVKEIKKLKKRRKYGIVWDEEKTKEKFDKDSENKLPILKEVKSNEIQTNNSSPTNILIEGDNYHSLSVLNYTHAKRVDVIYIDPPYNLGGEAKEFRYNDKFVDNEDAFRHSKWLSFMSNRLKLAKNLLKPDGFLLISINDVEDSQLRLLCDELFGEQNFISKLIWKTRENVDSRSLTGVSTDHEYVLAYRRSSKGKFRGKKINREKYKNPDDDPKGSWMSSPIDGIATKDRRPNLHYTIVNPKTGQEYNPNPANGWRFQPSTLSRLIQEDRIIWPKNPKSKPRFKRYLNELQSEFTGFSSLLDTVYYSAGTRELRNIMKKEAFKFPKPKELISTLLEQHENKNALIVDFFAGSGTTGHAVLESNKIDGGNRKFILCTNDEGEISTQVCYPRLQHVIKGYSDSKNEKIEGLGGNLKYFKTDFVDGEPTDKNKKRLVEQCTEMLCLREDCFDEIKQTKNYSIFKNHEGKYLGIIYDDDGIEHLKKQIKSLGTKFNVYVFSLDDSVREEEFEDVKGMVDLKPIPEVILNVYRRIFK